MLTTKYHIGTIIAIFFALGIGILIGGTLGQQWVDRTEDSIVQMLMNRYERQVTENKMLQKQIGSLQLMSRTVAPILNQKKILWIKPEAVKNEMLAVAMKSAGAEWFEESSEALPAAAGEAFTRQTVPDIIVISDPQISDYVNRQLQNMGAALPPKVVDISSAKFTLDEPQDVVNFIMYLKKITEEESRETFGFYRYSGLE